MEFLIPLHILLHVQRLNPGLLMLYQLLIANPTHSSPYRESTPKAAYTVDVGESQLLI